MCHQREEDRLAGRMSDKVDREPANRAGTTLKNRLVNPTLPGIKVNFGEKNIVKGTSVVQLLLFSFVSLI